jgi:hypothetical protein
MHMIHNEQTKLRATFANNLGIGLAIGGSALPFIQNVPQMNILLAVRLLVPWLVGIGLHLGGVYVLKQLREDEPR